MRTIISLIFGSLLAAGFVYVAKALGRSTLAGIIAFLSVWLVPCVVDTAKGVRAGYSIAEEIMIHLLLFAVPAGVAYLTARVFY